MAIRLDVPYFTQLGIGARPGVAGRDDPTGCWYASACMIGAFYESGPRLGVPQLWVNGRHRVVSAPANGAAGVDYFEILCRNEQLVPNPMSADPLFDFEGSDIEGLLRGQGPIMLFWHKPAGRGSYQHASVIFGADGNTLSYHDPERAPDSRMSVDDFNRWRQRMRWALLQRRPGARPRV